MLNAEHLIMLSHRLQAFQHLLWPTQREEKQPAVSEKTAAQLAFVSFDQFTHSSEQLLTFCPAGPIQRIKTNVEQ
ncbi:hypothetical protein DBR34_00740 [Stenotrophomonas sp. HMWF003]|nr:hypothetical protein DBR34_00740 [Stenotrophomonas sp. HMWF003]